MGRGPGRRRPSPAAAIPCCRRRFASAWRGRRPWPRPGSPPPAVGAAHRATPAGRGRPASGHGVAAQRPLHETGRGAAVARAQQRSWAAIRTQDGRWSYLHCNFPNHRAAALGVLGVAEDRAAVAAAVAKWNAADLEEAIIAAKGAGGMVRTQAEWEQHPQAAAIAALPLMEIVQDRRQPARAAARGRPAAVRHPRARHHARAGRADLRAHPGRARRRRDEDHRRPPAQSRLPGMGHRPRQALGPARPAQPAATRDPARAGARGRRVLAGLPAGQPRRPRPVARGAGRAAARPRLCLAVGLRPRRAVGVAARLRHRGADGERHHPRQGELLPGKSRARNSIRSRRSTIAPAT